MNPIVAHLGALAVALVLLGGGVSPVTYDGELAPYSHIWAPIALAIFVYLLVANLLGGFDWLYRK